MFGLMQGAHQGSSGGGSLWTPASLGSAFALGLRAMDTNGANAGAEITQSSGAVSQWSDWSGNGRHLTQATSANQPIYAASTAALGNKPGVSFDGTNDSLAKTSSGLGSGTLNVFMLMRDDNYGGVYIEHSQAGFQAHQYFRKDSSNVRCTWRDGSNYASFVHDDFTTAHIYSALMSASLREVFMDGVSQGTNTTVETGGFSPTILTLAAASWGGAYGRIRLGELVLVSGTMTTSDRQKTEGYLAWKWGLQSQLDASHPYKSAAP